ncbi:hypothetical protein K7X08_001183 [Anisodus acutangulus]|uniref:Uncharacterized protein n=1 Tax=Anisodus acutangulus TaxID=402998 RepID=A0A9Q1MNX5_9SOLA|nr:hypothetical protein K7X08_001183 [Anisodus acutangulus]
MEQMNRKKRVRVNSDESEFNSPEVKKLRENLLDDFDDSEFSSTCHDFDDFMKSFEEEITPAPAPEVVDLTDESQLELGYLLEASDDELGLPPASRETTVESELIRVNSDSTELSNELWELSNYDSFELGINDLVDYNNDIVCEYVVLDGLFDHSDLGFGGFEDIGRNKSARYVGRLGRNEEFNHSSYCGSDDSEDELDVDVLIYQ